MANEMYLDAHVHCRDEEQSDKETIAHALSVAEDSGLDAIFDMPNTARPVTTTKRIEERFELARQANSPVFYGAYIGLTPNKDQIREAVECHRRFFPQGSSSRFGVIGVKMFAGKSVGDLEIIDPDKQEFIYAQLTSFGYNGVLAVHCEKESEMKPELWDPTNPETWNETRPERAETESVRDQLSFVKRTGYMGHLHICHVSVPESVDLIRAAGGRALRLSCGVTPHHLLLNASSMWGKDGILYKVNPPLREVGVNGALFEYVLDGKTDILESDHAPHTKKEKYEGQLSGIPNLASWPHVVSVLERLGMKPGLLNRMAFDSVNEIFRTKIQRTERGLKDRRGEYVFDPYDYFK